MDRRDFLRSLAIGGTALSTARLAAAFTGLSAGAFAPAQAQTRDRAAHAVARVTYGMTPDLFAESQRIGADALIAAQLQPDAIDMTAFDSLFTAWNDVLDLDVLALIDRFDMNRGELLQRLVGGMTVRAMRSPRQLYERMVWFFSNHFYIYAGKGNALFLKVIDDREAMRPHAMTSFRQILGASARSPAMLVYLDNARSDRRAPNENYARELLELHTLGVNGGYTEDDVKNVARAFTGWSIRARREENPFAYDYRRSFHDDDAKTILGVTIPAGGGESDGDRVLDILAAHPSTARFIATKIARRFVADAPPAELVESLAAGFLVSGGDVTTLLRDLFASEAFWNAPPKLKSPFEYVVSMLRAVEFSPRADERFNRTVTRALEAVGQVPFAWPAPNGYPDVAGMWRDGLIARWNTAVALFNGGGVSGGGVDSDRLLRLFDENGVAFDIESVVPFMGRYLFGRALTAEETAVTLTFARETDGEPDVQIAAAIALLLASPAFQYR